MDFARAVQQDIGYTDVTWRQSLQSLQQTAKLAIWATAAKSSHHTYITAGLPALLGPHSAQRREAGDSGTRKRRL